MTLPESEQIARVAVKRARAKGETNTEALHRLYYAVIATALIAQKEAA